MERVPPQPEGPSLEVRFPAERNATEWSLRLRQQDVKQSWKVLLNGKELGGLVADENDMAIYLPIPAGRLIAGENTLVLSQIGRIPDDIRVGEIVLDDRAVAQALSEATVEIRVHEVGPAEKPVPLPCRITVVTAQGALMTVGATSNDHLAVRPGVLYTGTGQARFGLSAGSYTIYAGAASSTASPPARSRSRLATRLEGSSRFAGKCRSTAMSVVTHMSTH